VLFPIRERANLEFRAEVYNLTNARLWASPGANYNLGACGVYRRIGGSCFSRNPAIWPEAEPAGTPRI